MRVLFRLSCPNHPCIVILGLIGSFFSIMQVHGQLPDKKDTLDISQMTLEMDTMGHQAADTTEAGFTINEGEFTGPQMGDPFDGEEDVPSFLTSYIWDPVRVGVKYEAAYKVPEPDRIIKNRFSLGLEYSGSLSKLLFLKMDTKLFTFLGGDHRARKSALWINDDSEEVDLSFGTLTRDAYLQASFNNTSIKAGIQAPVWGESDFAVITDEISPFDYREPLNLNIDELRFGQFMLAIDQYSSIGHWTIIFIPDPKLNKHPKEGTDYYYDPFDGNIEYQREEQDKNLFEYGLRWRKTFGKSDISVMTASLIDNEYALRQVAPGLITRSKQRFFMAGLTFNRAISSFLIKGEVAIKSRKPYNNSSFEIVKKNALDMSLGVDYSLSNTFTLSLEGVNYHVMDWTDEIQGVPRNNYMLFFVLSKQLMKEDLSLNGVTMYNGPYTGFFNLLTASYNWNDHITLNCDVLLPITDEVNSGYYPYRDQKQVGFGILYQF